MEAATAMTERELIFTRIREALRVAAPRPGGHATHATPASKNSDGARAWLPEVLDTPDTITAWSDLFGRQAANLKADFHLLADREEMKQALARLRDAEGWQRVASHSGELTDFVCPALTLPVLRTDAPYDVRALETCDAGITECDALVAQTGSVLVTSRSAGGRALSVLPPHHVVLARRRQLVPDLPAAFRLLQEKYTADYPSFVSFITGPSRTGDIERILVLGAHGPKKLTILCC